MAGKTTKCIMNGCDGVMTIKHTKPSRANGITKLFAVCTNCGNHNMSTAKGQQILRGVLEKQDTEDYDFEELPEPQPDERHKENDHEQEPEKKEISGNNSITPIIIGVGGVVLSVLTFGIFRKKQKK